MIQDTSRDAVSQSECMSTVIEIVYIMCWVCADIIDPLTISLLWCRLVVSRAELQDLYDTEATMLHALHDQICQLVLISRKSSGYKTRLAGTDQLYGFKLIDHYLIDSSIHDLSLGSGTGCLSGCQTIITIVVQQKGDIKIIPNTMNQMIDSLR